MNYFFQFKDPTGLAPEKKRGGGNKLQGVFVWTESEEYYAIEKFTQEWNSIKDYNYNWGDDPHNKFGEVANGGGGRLGPVSYWYVADEVDENGNYRQYDVSVWTNTGVEKIPTKVYNSGVPEGKTSEDVMNSLVGSINDIQQADPSFFDDTYNMSLSINIMGFNKMSYIDKDGIVKYGNMGKFTPSFNQCGGIITLAGDVLTGDKIITYPERESYYRDPSPTYQYQPYSIIAHEFGHAKHYSLLGGYDGYYNTPWYIREHYAYSTVNRIREFYGQPREWSEYEGSQFWRSIFYPNTWGKYYERGF